MYLKITIEKDINEMLKEIKIKVFGEDARRIRNAFLLSKMILERNHAKEEIKHALERKSKGNYEEKIATTMNFNSKAYEKLKKMSEEYTYSMADIIRAIILIKHDETMNKYKIRIESKQEWNKKELYFDPDASPESWEHYKKVYNGEFKEYDFNNLCFFNYLEPGRYVKVPLKFYNRLNSIKIEPLAKNEPYKKKWIKYFSPLPRLSGETDFNFNEKKYDIYLEILFKEYEKNEKEICRKIEKIKCSKKIKKSAEIDFDFIKRKGDVYRKGLSNDYLENKNKFYKNVDKLNYCNKMHHTLVNFSLIQVTGNMQGVKSRGLFLNNTRDKKYEYLDRLDTFVYMLSEYYSKNKNYRSQTLISKNATNDNRRPLEEYLDAFGTVYKYCEKIYFIKDEPFINKIITNGEKVISSADDVINYMNLAIEFWEKKSHHFMNLEKKSF